LNPNSYADTSLLSWKIKSIPAFAGGVPPPKSYHHGMQLKSELASQILKQLHDMGISSSSESDEEPTSGPASDGASLFRFF